MASGSIVPEIKFDWLGTLPGLAEESRLRNIRANVGPIDFSSSDAISKAARQLAAGGDWESALRLTQLATARETAEAAKTSAAQRGADIELWREMIKAGRFPGYLGGPSTAPPPTEPSSTIVAPPGPAPSVPAPGGLPGMPGMGTVGPRTSLPPSPSEALLTQAEGPAQAPAAPVQLAGPPPTPDTAGPPAMPSPGPVPFVPSPGPVPGVTTPAPTTTSGPMPTRTPEQEAAHGAELKIGNATVQLPPRSASWPLYRTNMIALQNAL